MYADGEGVAQDYVEAAKWYRRAAEQGDDSAQFNLGRMYADGEGVAQDYVEAAKWYRRAAEQGDDSAQFNLGRMYADGEGVAQDYVLAHMWLNLSTSRTSGDEHKGDAEMRDAIAVEMTREQVAEAQRLAREWKPKTWEELLSKPEVLDREAYGWVYGILQPFFQYVDKLFRI